MVRIVDQAAGGTAGMSGTGVWTRSRETFRRFPERFAQCPAEVRDQGSVSQSRFNNL